MTVFNSELMKELDGRGLIKDCSDVSGLDAALATGRKIAVYAGFDPTAGSLHVGHLTTLTVLRMFARHGHKVLPLIGTGTAMIGDPTGRTTARRMLTANDVDLNASGVSRSIELALNGIPAEIVRNGDWIGDTGLVWFLREVGSRIPLSQLLAQESVKSRLGGAGISFLEACYPLLQAWDFWHLSAQNPVMLQVGGSDQFGNICMGLELIGRFGMADGQRVFGLTHPLLTHANGEKMGKTTGGAVWLNPDAMDDFGFFRFWRTLPDADAPRIARMLSDVDIALITGAAAGGSSESELLKEALAYSMTAAIRGDAAALVAENASRGRGRVAVGLPTADATPDEAADLPGLMVKAGLAPSKGAARRLAANGGLRVNGEQRLDPVLTEAEIDGETLVLSAGKTLHRAIRVAPAPHPMPSRR